MKFVVVLLLYLQSCYVAVNYARPAGHSLDADNYIISGSNADGGAWPWQLCHEMYFSGSGWSHACGALLLSPTRALTAAHCLIGSVASNNLIKAGLTDRLNMTGVQLSVVSSYVLHERYQQDPGHLSNDLAIMHLTTAISVNSKVQFLTLPPDNSNSYTDQICIITGWGRTSESNDMAQTLQQASIRVTSTSECAQRMQPITDRIVTDKNICVFEEGIGTCNGDSGGPLNCPDGKGGHLVAGVVSWSVHIIDGSGRDICVKSYPSVYTRTGAYIDWINTH